MAHLLFGARSVPANGRDAYPPLAARDRRYHLCPRHARAWLVHPGPEDRVVADRHPTASTPASLQLSTVNMGAALTLQTTAQQRTYPSVRRPAGAGPTG